MSVNDDLGNKVMEGKGQKLENRFWRITFDTRSGRLDLARREGGAPSVSNALIGLSCAKEGGKKQMAGFAGNISNAAGEQLQDVHGRGMQYRFISAGRLDGLELTYRINLYDERPFL